MKSNDYTTKRERIALCLSARKLWDGKKRNTNLLLVGLKKTTMRLKNSNALFDLNEKQRNKKPVQNEQSSKKTASLAAKVLRQKTSTKTAKSLAASVLTQAPDKKKKNAKLIL